jgi:ribonuclease E
MTFYEAALRILEESGAPLHADEITKRAIEKGMLSHIGKTPEVTMLARLAAMAKRSIERRLSVTAKDTFALTEWMLVEDPAALDATGVFLPHPESARAAKC